MIQLKLWRNWRLQQFIDWGKYPKTEPIYIFFALGPVEIRYLFNTTDILDLDLMRPDGIKKCLYCDTEITASNDSGWEGFTEFGSRPICNTCYERPQPTLKSEN